MWKASLEREHLLRRLVQIWVPGPLKANSVNRKLQVNYLNISNLFWEKEMQDTKAKIHFALTVSIKFLS